MTSRCMLAAALQAAAAACMHAGTRNTHLPWPGGAAAGQLPACPPAAAPAPWLPACWHPWQHQPGRAPQTPGRQLQRSARWRPLRRLWRTQRRRGRPRRRWLRWPCSRRLLRCRPRPRRWQRRQPWRTQPSQRRRPAGCLRAWLPRRRQQQPAPAGARLLLACLGWRLPPRRLHHLASWPRSEACGATAAGDARCWGQRTAGGPRKRASDDGSCCRQHCCLHAGLCPAQRGLAADAAGHAWLQAAGRGALRLWRRQASVRPSASPNPDDCFREQHRVLQPSPGGGWHPARRHIPRSSCRQGVRGCEGRWWQGRVSCTGGGGGGQRALAVATHHHASGQADGRPEAATQGAALGGGGCCFGHFGPARAPGAGQWLSWCSTGAWAWVRLQLLQGRVGWATGSPPPSPTCACTPAADARSLTWRPCAWHPRSPPSPQQLARSWRWGAAGAAPRQPWRNARGAARPPPAGPRTREGVETRPGTLHDHVITHAPAVIVLAAAAPCWSAHVAPSPEVAPPLTTEAARPSPTRAWVIVEVPGPSESRSGRPWKGRLLARAPRPRRRDAWDAEILRSAGCGTARAGNNPGRCCAGMNKSGAMLPRVLPRLTASAWAVR